MYYSRKKHITITVLLASLLVIIGMTTSAINVHGAESDSEKPGLVIMGDGVKGTEGFQKNVIYLTVDQKEDIKETRDPEKYGLGNCWISGMRYSSYDNHGTGGWHYTIADGLDVKKLTDAVTDGKSDEIGSVWLYSSDTYSTKLIFSEAGRMMYYPPGTSIDSERISDPPMIAYYKTTTKTDDPENGVEPDGPAEKLASGSETYVYGQKSGPKDDNNCHYIKSVNTVEIGDFSCFIRSSNDRYAIATLRDIICKGIECRTYDMTGGNGNSTSFNVKGVSLESVMDRMGIDKFMPDYADIRIQAVSSSGETLSISREQLKDSIVAWGFSDDRETPAEQTGYLAFYTKDSDGNGIVLYDLSRVNITDKDGNVLTQVPQKPDEPVKAPAAVKTLEVSSVTYDSVKLTWTKSENATGYDIYRSTKESSGYSKVNRTPVTSTSFTNKSLKTGTKYYYRVKALRTEGTETAESGYSKYVSARPYLNKPTVKLTAGKKKMTVKWNRISGATGYKIYRSTKKSSGYKCVKTVTKSSTTSYMNKSLKKGTKYYYKVRAYRKSGSKYAYSSYSSVRYTKAK